MIRKCRDDDIQIVLEIWLKTSTIAHDFVSPDFWVSQTEAMRTIYLPASDSYIFENEHGVVGFCSLYENHLAALFVAPEYQRQGIGKKLLDHAKKQAKKLTLSVYKENVSSYQFYFSQGFKVISEQPDQHTGHSEFTMIFHR
ncbi:N-acetyltransferase [Vibrio salinus]|uniref:N-acetyltransferase n=1 Tax=Vibrio salinus TaxID=2899784 RepID=UPI001E3C7720|nr:N-acetyltransferase [Vibrio salinus]MCE0492458.1 N-acetyltransferase [Vibrio salinus]